MPTLATTRTGSKGSLEVWFDTNPSRWFIYAFVSNGTEMECYRIDLDVIEQRHSIGDAICNEGKLPVNAVKVEMSPVAALLHAGTLPSRTV